MAITDADKTAVAVLVTGYLGAQAKPPVSMDDWFRHYLDGLDSFGAVAKDHQAKKREARAAKVKEDEAAAAANGMVKTLPHPRARTRVATPARPPRFHT